MDGPGAKVGGLLAAAEGQGANEKSAIGNAWFDVIIARVKMLAIMVWLSVPYIGSVNQCNMYIWELSKRSMKGVSFA